MRVATLNQSLTIPVIGGVVNDSADLANAFRSIYEHGTIDWYESSYAIYINRNNEIIGWDMIGLGSRSECSFNLQIVSRSLSKNKAYWVAFAHNHPSGDVKPSDTDIKSNESLKIFCQLLEVSFVDHIILTSDNYYSFTDNNFSNKKGVTQWN